MPSVIEHQTARQRSSDTRRVCVLAQHRALRSDAIDADMSCKSLSTLSQKSATVAEFGDCRRCLAVFCDSRTFLRQCGQCGQGFSQRSRREMTSRGRGHKMFSDYNCFERRVNDDLR